MDPYNGGRTRPNRGVLVLYCVSHLCQLRVAFVLVTRVYYLILRATLVSSPCCICAVLCVTLVQQSPPLGSLSYRQSIV
jgi:hypothetical protein